MAQNDRTRRTTQPPNPSTRPRGAGVGTSSTTPTPSPAAGGSTPATAPNRSRMQGGATAQREMPTPAPNMPGYRRPQPQGREGPPGPLTPQPSPGVTAPTDNPLMRDAPQPPPGPEDVGGQPVPEGTYDAPENGGSAYAGVPMSGDVGLRPGAGTRASASGGGSTTRTSTGPAQPLGAVGVRGVMDSIGITGPGAAQDPDVAPVRGADTEQGLRDNLREQQEELNSRLLNVVDEIQNTDTTTHEGFSKVSRLQGVAKRLNSALGATTQGGARTFGANRSYDATIQGAGIGANADAEIARADNAARLGISENSAATSIFGDLMQRRSATERNQARVAAAQAQNAPTQMERVQLDLMQHETENGNFENVVNMAFGRDVFGDMTIQRDEMGQPTGMLRTQGGQLTRMPAAMQNVLEQFRGKSLTEEP